MAERGRDAARRLALEWVNERRAESGLVALDSWPVARGRQSPLNRALPPGWSARLTIQGGARCGWLTRPGQSTSDILPSAPYYFLVYFGRGYYPDLEPLDADSLALRVDLPRADIEALTAGGPALDETLGALEAVADGSDTVRAAILMPVGDSYETLYEAAERGDEERIREIGRELVRRIKAGELAGLVERPAPSLKRLVGPNAAERVRDHLRGCRPEGEGDTDAAA